MKQILKRALINLTPPIILKLVKAIVKPPQPSQKIIFCHDEINSYSQFQEDLILDSITGNKANGFYIDIGAFDPTDISNTKKFYERGWSGINVDPIKSVIDKFNKVRPRDINLNVGIASADGFEMFHEFNEKYLSTFSEEKISQIKRKFPNAVLKESYLIKTISLENLIRESNMEVDFLSIDVEGFELSVLNSNNWNLYRPKVVLIEVLSNKIEIFQILEANNYKCVFCNNYNAIFIDLLNI
jgi:FkbM family methyltransferase